MYLKSLKVTDFAGIAQAELAPFEPGLNVVVGNNEAGKSTLLAALRAAFFLKHRAGGEAVKALAPYRGEGRPEVTVAFELGGRDYALSKAFLQRTSAELSWSGGRLSGDAVEEKLAELLGFIHPGRGDPKLAEHQGAFGLLWVEQGRSNLGLDVGAGKDALTASLEGEVGQMLGGERGRGLIAAARALQDRFFTATGRVAQNSPLKIVEDDLVRLQAELEEKRRAWQELEEQLNRLDDRRRRLKDYEAAGTVQKAEDALRAAEEAARRAVERDREWQAAQAALRHAEAARQAAVERLGRRDQLAKRADEAARAAEAARVNLAEIDTELRGANTALDRAEQERAKAQEAEAEAERRHEALRLADELARERAGRDELGRAIAEAEALVEQAGVKRRALEASRVDAKALAAIDQAERRRRDCAIRLSVAAPTVRFEPDAAAIALREDGIVVAPGESHPVARRTRFRLEGFGSLVIEPGGDAAALADESRAAEESLRLLFARHEVSSLEDARKAVETASELRAEIAALDARREALLSSGLDEARIRLGSAENAIARLEQRLQEQGTSATPPGEAPASTEAVREALDAARRRGGEARAAVDSARARVGEAALRRASADSEAEHRGEEARRLKSEREHAEAEAPRQRLVEDLAAADADREAKAGQLALRERDRAAADPKAAEAERESCRQALDRIRRTVLELRDETLSLEGEIRGKEGSGLGETIAAHEDEAAELDRRRSRLRLEAEASKLLHDELVAAQREARERWLGPIKSRVAPYLRLIHPETEIELDEETLDIRGLHRDGVSEKFERLSAGAREQVAVVARLALAHVLKQGGHPATVILDDALVNTDEARLERMHRVLREAARELQIIVLTCRERDFRDLGAPIFRL